VRSQIALDLHDDLGAGLAQIAIQSEVARRSDGLEGAARRERIAEIARGLRASMDDIVWAVDPRRDTAGDLIQRLRKTATELFELHATQFDFRAQHGAADDALRIPPDRRRHAHLIVKEALTNVARHAQAAHVTVEVALDARALAVRITDDGRGFDTGAPRTGRGLDNMARRARELGAELSIDSAPGRGTRWTLRIPLRSAPHDRAGRTAVRAK
jgi:signal transduction histidine kinase